MKLKISPLAYSLLTHLFKFPTSEFAFRELERKSGLSIGTISKYVRELKHMNLVKIRPAAKAKFVSANQEERTFIELKRAYNLNILYSSGLVDYLIKNFRPDAIVVFGSFSKGEDHEDSDIDIAIIHGRYDRLDLASYEKELGRRIVLTKVKHIKDASNEFINTLVNGIILSGFMEVL